MNCIFAFSYITAYVTILLPPIDSFPSFLPSFLPFQNLSIPSNTFLDGRLPFCTVPFLSVETIHPSIITENNQSFSNFRSLRIIKIQPIFLSLIFLYEFRTTKFFRWFHTIFETRHSRITIL